MVSVAAELYDDARVQRLAAVMGLVGKWRDDGPETPADTVARARAYLVYIGKDEESEWRADALAHAAAHAEGAKPSPDEVIARAKVYYDFFAEVLSS